MCYENSVDAAEEQGGEGDVAQQEADMGKEGLAACSQTQEEVQPRHCQKRELSRSLDLSRGSVSSRVAKHQKQGKNQHQAGMLPTSLEGTAGLSY